MLRPWDRWVWLTFDYGDYQFKKKEKKKPQNVRKEENLAQSGSGVGLGGCGTIQVHVPFFG